LHANVGLIAGSMAKIANSANGSRRDDRRLNAGKHRLHQHGIAQNCIGKKLKILNTAFVEWIPINRSRSSRKR